ncbi:hypothetical protein EVAR_66025_1 [Eumeta japonica]|uniref:Uncharacterized protein n=1 Tax=Eumeta variegata TaxID=151549 RepID=A0A4C1Z8Q2_EUMVA|nr:hypothetical protein EVAR_66025_1 [Eumeta japonica]
MQALDNLYFPYPEIGSFRLDCGDEVRQPSRLVPRRGETRTGDVRFADASLVNNDRPASSRAGGVAG